MTSDLQETHLWMFQEVQNNAAHGTDHFPAVLIKERTQEFSEPHYLLWRHLDN